MLGFIILIIFWVTIGISTFFIMTRKNEYKHLKTFNGFVFMLFFGLFVATVLLRNKNKQIEQNIREWKSYRGY